MKMNYQHILVWIRLKVNHLRSKRFISVKTQREMTSRIQSGARKTENVCGGRLAVLPPQVVQSSSHLIRCATWDAVGKECSLSEKFINAITSERVGLSLCIGRLLIKAELWIEWDLRSQLPSNTSDTNVNRTLRDLCMVRRKRAYLCLMSVKIYFLCIYMVIQGEESKAKTGSVSKPRKKTITVHIHENKYLYK